MYHISRIAAIVEGNLMLNVEDSVITQLAYDSRKVQQPAASLFFALVTEHNDGHNYLGQVIKKGVRNVVVSEKRVVGKWDQVNYIVVEDTLLALQQLAAWHRSQFSIPVIGITGSNGKTVVKEWLFQLLQDSYNIVRSPKSYNSQLGVALSLWEISAKHTLGIFEAGISHPGEMVSLEKMIRPTIGILTNIGEAHAANFGSPKEKLAEKLKLFEHADLVIGEQQLLQSLQGRQVFSWGYGEDAALRLLAIATSLNETQIRAKYQGQEIAITIPFTDAAAVQNAINCWCAGLWLGISQSVLMERFRKLHVVDMRLQMNQGINGCLVINDSYSADLTSLKIALDFLRQQGAGMKKTVILSEFVDTGMPDELLYREMAGLLHESGIDKAVFIGEKIGSYIEHYLPAGIDKRFYLSTTDFINDFKTSGFFNEIVLIKGARKFEFERIARMFERKLHETALEVNLNALAHNLKEYQRLLRPETKLMVMVKAFSYGSGGAEIANVLEFHNVDYLGVAYADEGVELVKSGIQLPVMVMNAESSSFQSIVNYNLQPVIYSWEVLHEFEHYVREQGLLAYPVHLEIETGMNRLGFALPDVPEVASYIAASRWLRIQSVFSHLAASEDPSEDAFTAQQAVLFRQAAEMISAVLPYPFLKHISNSAAIVRHPGLQMDMVRLGIGIYGIEIDAEQRLDLLPVATLRSTVAQLKQLRAGESVSYNRRGVVSRDSRIATVRIGYADGYSRRFGNGVGRMWVHGRLAPVIGTVCMDMTIIDVTDIPGVKEGDEVIVFGPQLRLQQMAAWIQTIPYEIMTGISQRVKRIYFHE